MPLSDTVSNRPHSLSPTSGVTLGDGAYGAEEAAETYCGKSATGLSLDEAAALAGFLHSP